MARLLDCVATASTTRHTSQWWTALSSRYKKAFVFFNSFNQDKNSKRCLTTVLQANVWELAKAGAGSIKTLPIIMGR